MTAKKKFKSKPRKIKMLLFFVRFFLALTVVAVIGIYSAYKFYAQDLPDLTVITGYQPNLISEVYSSDGTLIGEFASEHRKFIPYEDIPPYVGNAFIAVEDRRFLEHEGVDVKSIIAAMIENAQEGNWVRGASTITQQVIKNTILSPERTISRKIKEAILAHRIENNLSKEEILYLYLNHIYLADGTYGIEYASRNYFGKRAKDINLAEAALLAGLPKKPEYFSPRKYPERALDRQKLVLKKMEEEGFISEYERLKAAQYQINIVSKQKINSKLAPYFVEHVRRYLEHKVGTKAFLAGGYTIFTTLDVSLNFEAQWALKRRVLDLESRRGRRIVSEQINGDAAIETWKKKQGVDSIEFGKTYEAVVKEVKGIGTSKEGTLYYVANVGVGAVEGILKYAVRSPVMSLSSPLDNDNVIQKGSYYQNVSVTPVRLKPGDVIKVKAVKREEEKYYFSLVISSQTQGALVSMDTKGNVLTLVGGFDYQKSQFNRVTQALRQPGSAFKPILYSAAVDKGYAETSALSDMPVVINDWKPQNYDEDYLGAITLREAFAKSRNLASVRLILDIDPEYVVNYSRKFGFTSPMGPYPSLALGGTDLKVIEMATAYNVFANGGKLVKARFILRIYDRNGRIIEDNTGGGDFLSKEESLKAQREEKKLHIISEIAKKKGRGRNWYGEYLRERNLMDNDLLVNENKHKFFTPDEFLQLIRSEPIDFGRDHDYEQTLSPETAYIMTDLLEAVVKEGTGKRALRLTSLAPVAGKTGTTNNYTDAWFVGFSPNITTAVWVGRDDHKSLGYKETGSRAALPIWIDYMEAALSKYPGGSFEKPHGVKIVKTPYGDIPYNVDSLRRYALENDDLLNNNRLTTIKDNGEGDVILGR